MEVKHAQQRKKRQLLRDERGRERLVKGRIRARFVKEFNSQLRCLGPNEIVESIKTSDMPIDVVASDVVASLSEASSKISDLNRVWLYSEIDRRSTKLWVRLKRSLTKGIV